jgi:NADH-quinone oxidoreductase subunit G
VSVPVFCYHPKMAAVGMCRMCMVEVYTPMIDRATNQPVLDEHGQPKLALMANKLQAGCVTPVSPGMVVKTVTDRVKFAQRGQLEFLLTSHPLDCPVCDKGGECPLQNLTMEWGPGNSRYDYTDKQHFVKPIPLGDLIYLDRERCILCSRCVRFEDELAGDPVLGFNNRGRSWEIISKSTPAFDSKFSGNTTDICPVGALTSADFRFKARVWELRSIPSVDPHTCEGANITVDFKYDDVKRIMPRENDFVNEIWIADKSRFGHHFASSPDRITTPLIRRGSKLEPCTWDEALRTVAEKLAAIKGSAGGSAIGGIAGDHCANEDLFLFQKLMRDVLGSTNVDHRSGAANDLPLDTLGQRFGVGRGTNLMTLGKDTTVLVLGADVEEEAPLYLLRLRTMQQRGAQLIVANGRRTKLDDAATQRLRYRYGDEAALLSAMASVILDENLGTRSERVGNLDGLRRALGNYSPAAVAQRTGVSEDAIRNAARAFAGAKNAIVVYGREAQSAGADVQTALANLALLTGAFGRANSGLLPLLPHNNTRGALDLGVRPDQRPGAAPSQGMGSAAMLQAASQGKLRGLYIMGADPAANNPAARAALEAAEFVVVQELFLTETAQLADVVLPAAPFLEREGTYTNAERRVQRFRQGRGTRGESRADWAIVRDVARAILDLTTVELAATPAAAAAKATRSARAAASTTTVVQAQAAPDAQWRYNTAADVMAEIARAVPGFSGAGYAALSASGTGGGWGRQVNEAVYYDGTSYTNTEGVGVQLPAASDDGKGGALALNADLPEPRAAGDGGLTLVGATAHYNGGTLMRGSLLLKRLVQPALFISADDATSRGIANGDAVTVTSVGGAVTLPARIDPTMLPGAVVAYDNLAAAPLAGVVAGGRTAVQVAKAEA